MNTSTILSQSVELVATLDDDPNAHPSAKKKSKKKKKKGKKGDGQVDNFIGDGE